MYTQISFEKFLKLKCVSTPAQFVNFVSNLHINFFKKKFRPDGDLNTSSCTWYGAIIFQNTTSIGWYKNLTYQIITLKDIHFIELNLFFQNK